MSTLAQSAPLLASPAGSRQRTNTFLVLGLALAGRLLVAWYTLVHLPAGWLFTRGLEMDLVAKSLLAGQGLSSPYGPPTGPTAMISPAYPLLIAAIFRVFGIDTLASAIVVLTIHVALNLATAWLILHLSRRFAHEDAACLAAGFWACSPPMLWLPTIFWETSFSTFFLLALVAFAFSFDRAASQRHWLAYGCAGGLAGLFNPALLPATIALGAWAAFRTGRPALRKSLFALAALVLVYSPWPIRNAHVFRAVILTRSTYGYDLWVGNHPGATGSSDESLFPAFNPEGLADYKLRGEVGYFAHKSDLARQYILTHPGHFLRLTLFRVLRYWSGTGNRKTNPFLALHGLTTMLLGGFGLAALLRSPARHRALFVVIPLLLFPAPYYLSHADFKYRLILDPLLCVLAACAIHRLPENDLRCAAEG